jgi:perosamine synthetase
LDDILKPGPEGPVNRYSGRPVKALIVMHVFGHPADMDPLVALCDRHGISLIEDAAESLGSRYKNRHTGLDGRLSALSFNGNKIVTTGGGGAILTQDAELARRAKHLTTTARVAHRWQFMHDEVGYNYRMPNINAALGCAQLERLPQLIEAKRRLATRYAEAFSDFAGAHFYVPPAFASSNHWLNAILLDERHAPLRDEVLEAMNAAGIMSRPAWTLMHQLPMYTSRPRMAVPVAEHLAQSLINIPSSAVLGERL